eukprot:UN25927
MSDSFTFLKFSRLADELNGAKDPPFFSKSKSRYYPGPSYSVV